MFIIHGKKYFGTVDCVPGLFYVDTIFIHAYFIPLVPLGSYIILARSETESGPRGVRTRLSLKSILAAWVRTVFVVGFLWTLIGGVWVTIEFFDPKSKVKPIALLVVWGVCASMAVAYVLTHRFNRASYDRAMQLGKELGLDSALVEKYHNAAREGRDPRSEPSREPEGWERYS